MRTVHTEDAPEFQDYPFPQAIVHDGLVHLSGNVPIDPTTGEIVSGDIEAQTKQVFENIESILETAGADLEDVIKVTVFLRSREDYDEFNRVYANQFDNHYPARSAVVADIVVDADLEVEVLAAAGSTGDDEETPDSRP